MMGEGRCPLADCFFPPDTRHPERKRRISVRIVSEGKAGKYQSAGRRRIGGIPERKRGPPSAEGQQPCAFARSEGCVASLRGLSGIRRAVFPNTRGFRRLRRPGSSRHRASPWAAPVLPTERAGSEESIVCCLRQRTPFGGWRHHLSPAKAGALWVLGNGVKVSLWQQRRENRTTGLRPWKNRQTALRAMEMHPFCRLRRRLSTGKRLT